MLLKWVSLESQELGALDRARPGVAVSFDPFSVRELGLALYISKTEISESLHRSVDAGLAIRSHGRIKPNRRNMLEFMIHGFKYAFPAKKGATERGIETAFAAPSRAAGFPAPLAAAGPDFKRRVRSKSRPLNFGHSVVPRAVV